MPRRQDAILNQLQGKKKPSRKRLDQILELLNNRPGGRKTNVGPGRSGRSTISPKPGSTTAIPTSSGLSRPVPGLSIQVGDLSTLAADPSANVSGRNPASSPRGAADAVLRARKKRKAKRGAGAIDV